MAVIASRSATPSSDSTALHAPHFMIQALWFVAVAAVAFLVPFLLTTIFSMNEDLYYFSYFLIALAVLGCGLGASRSRASSYALEEVNPTTSTSRSRRPVVRTRDTLSMNPTDLGQVHYDQEW
jgi:hypothetical protein